MTLCAQKIGKLLTIVGMLLITNPFGLHVRVRDESVGIQVHHSLVGFILRIESICGVFWATIYFYFASQILWKISLFFTFVRSHEFVSQTSVLHVPPGAERVRLLKRLIWVLPFDNERCQSVFCRFHEPQFVRMLVTLNCKHYQVRVRLSMHDDLPCL